MHDLRVETWNELSDRLYQPSWNPGLNRLRSNYVYRGMAGSGFDLSTSQMRPEGPFWGLEAAKLASFRTCAQTGMLPADPVWNWLALAQHHGLPTRLLDWTYSPHVALHFMTEAPETYGWTVRPGASTGKVAHEALSGRLRARLAAERMDMFTADMLQAEAPTLRDFERLAQGGIRGVLRAAVGGRAHREPVFALLVNVEPAGAAGRPAGGAARSVGAARRARKAEVGDPRPAG